MNRPHEGHEADLLRRVRHRHAPLHALGDAFHQGKDSAAPAIRRVVKHRHVHAFDPFGEGEERVAAREAVGFSLQKDLSNLGEAVLTVTLRRKSR